jgi:hypothetical protein
MTFAELVLAVHDWQQRLPRAQVRDAIERQLRSEEGVEGFRRGISVGAVLVMIRMGLGPGMRPVVFHDPRRDEAPEPASKPAERAPRLEWRGRPSKSAKALLREHLEHGPKPGAEIEAAAEAAAIPERSLVAAASSLNVRTRRGQWWLPPLGVDSGKRSPPR